MFDPASVIDYQTYCAKVAALKLPYWTKTLDERWLYTKLAVETIKTIQPKTGLELGTNGLSLMKFSDTIALTDAHVDPANACNRVYLFDVKHVPWPIADKQYDVFVALQVFEHLSPAQSAIFSEVKRISRWAILSFPYLWNVPHDKMHHMITDDKIAGWTNHHTPESSQCVGENTNCKRKLFVYKFD